MPRKKVLKTEEIKKEKKPKEAPYYQAVGRRKEATARVRLSPLGGAPGAGNGEIIVNDRPIEKYFPGKAAKIAYLQPFQLTNTLGRFRVTVKVEGGGLSGQLGALIHGLARTLEKVDPTYRPIFKKHKLLTRDPREKERRKAGLAHKARAKKQSPKR